MVGISSFGLPLAAFAGARGAGPRGPPGPALEAFCAEQGLDLLLLMASFDDEIRPEAAPGERGAHRRQLAILAGRSGGEAATERLAAFLQAADGGKLGLAPLAELPPAELLRGGGITACYTFEQTNVQATRKQVQPLVAACFAA